MRRLFQRHREKKTPGEVRICSEPVFTTASAASGRDWLGASDNRVDHSGRWRDVTYARSPSSVFLARAIDLCDQHEDVPFRPLLRHVRQQLRAVELRPNELAIGRYGRDPDLDGGITRLQGDLAKNPPGGPSTRAERRLAEIEELNLAVIDVPMSTAAAISGDLILAQPALAHTEAIAESMRSKQLSASPRSPLDTPFRWRDALRGRDLRGKRILPRFGFWLVTRTLDRWLRAAWNVVVARPKSRGASLVDALEDSTDIWVSTVDFAKSICPHLLAAVLVRVLLE